jgi:hypothetical protein
VTAFVSLSQRYVMRDAKVRHDLENRTLRSSRLSKMRSR